MSDLNAIKESQEAFQREWEQYKTTNDARLKVIEEKGFEPAAIREEFKRRDDKLDGFHESHKKLTDELAEEHKRLDQIETAMKRPGAGGTEVKSAEQLEHKAKVEAYLRRGVDTGLKELEQKILQTGSDPDGGYALTPDVEAGVMTRVRETSPMRQLATVLTIRSNSYRKRRVTGHAASGGWVSERATRSTTATPTLGMVQIDLHEQYAEPDATQQALDDLDMSVEQWLASEVEQTLLITENAAHITGDGVGKPRGITTHTSGTDDTAFQIQQVASGHATQVTSDGLVDLQDALFEAYQPNAAWIMQRATRSAIRKLKDGSSQYRLNIDFSTDAAATILGKRVFLAADMPAVGAGNLAIAYGDFRLGYNIVDKVGIRVLRDPYTVKGSVLFYTTKRTGGGVVQPQAIKLQVISA